VITTSPVASAGKTALTVKSSPNTISSTVTSIVESTLDTVKLEVATTAL